MSKEDLKITPVDQEMTKEDLKNVNGGSSGGGWDGPKVSCPKYGS